MMAFKALSMLLIVSIFDLCSSAFATDLAEINLRTKIANHVTYRICQHPADAVAVSLPTPPPSPESASDIAEADRLRLAQEEYEKKKANAIKTTRKDNIKYCWKTLKSCFGHWSPTFGDADWEKDKKTDSDWCSKAIDSGNDCEKTLQPNIDKFTTHVPDEHIAREMPNSSACFPDIPGTFRPATSKGSGSP